MSDKYSDIKRLAMCVFIAVLILITAIMASLMKAEKGTEERNWWIFLMVASWTGFIAMLVLTGFTSWQIARKMLSLKGAVEQATEQKNDTVPPLNDDLQRVSETAL